MTGQRLEEKFILLEISGEQGDLEQYKKILCEASLLNINHVIFGCVWDDNEKRGEELLKKVQEICTILNIVPFNMTVGYENVMFDQAMVGELKKVNDTVTPDFSSMISIYEYKMLKGITIEEAQIAKKLAKFI